MFGKDTVTEQPVDLKVLHAKIGQLTLENDFSEGALTRVGLLSAGKRGTRLRRDDRSWPRLPISRQALLVGISRGSVYYQTRPVNTVDLELMRHIDELHLEHPFMGARMLRDQFNRNGFIVGRKQVNTLMERMGVEALYKKPNTSKKHPGHKIYPYLLRDLAIEEANQVWALNTSYIPMAKGFAYITAIVGWASRKVLGIKGGDYSGILPYCICITRGFYSP